MRFDNRFIRVLPADPETASNSRQVTGACYSRILPVRAANPELVAYSCEVMESLGLDDEDFSNGDFTQILSGNLMLPGMETYAVCYGGHQFGSWAGQLGDGRVINLGEVVTAGGEYFTLQLKGAGPTPYSRTADGMAVLRSSVREFLCSESMHHLGIATTRALSLVLTGGTVIRDMFYDGNQKLEKGAIVCRVAPSFTRFGNFEIFAARGDIKLLKQLVDYTIRMDFPHLGEPAREVYIKWFEEVCRRTAQMIIHWQRVGFVHGVMNTDNMSILGLTIDYGPYGWLEDYDIRWTPNTTDANTKRYCFGNQPYIGFWNLAQLANALYPLIQDAELLQDAINVYRDGIEKGLQDMAAEKLGLVRFKPETDAALNNELLDILQVVETDMTIFYRNLSLISADYKVLEMSNEELMAPLMDAYYVPGQLNGEYKMRIGNWLRDYIKRLHLDGVSDDVRRKKMNAVNPKYVLRNYLAQLAIDKAENGDYSLVNELLDVLRKPYAEQPGRERFAAKRPDWARSRAGCSMLSCSS